MVAFQTLLAEDLQANRKHAQPALYVARQLQQSGTNTSQPGLNLSFIFSSSHGIQPRRLAAVRVPDVDVVSWPLARRPVVEDD